MGHSSVFIKHGEVVGWPRWFFFGDCQGKALVYGGEDGRWFGLP